ncbi:MAG TPA: FecR family protein [Polyangiaceae bacterium]|nr:FecR family protein [Polyangiaceae bacterium]
MRHRFEVEDLPPDRWARIEREVFDRLDREEQAPVSVARPTNGPRRAIATFVLAGAAAAVIGAVAWETLRPASRGEASRVTTDAAATHVQVGENELEVGAHSSVAIAGNDGAGIEIALDQGDIDCEVAPRRGRPPFVVSAGDVRVRVVGTHFHVARHGEDTRVSVDHGTVEVSEHANVTLVHAGESWPPPAPTQPAAPAPAPVDARPSATTALVAPSPSARPAAAPALTNAAQGEPSRRERYERALGLESSQPDAALSTYRELAVGSDAWAMNALFAESRLELERGHAQEARRLASDYLSRFPNGPNARDARELRARPE